MTSEGAFYAILYDAKVRYAMYGGLYFSMFLFVAILSGVKTYQNEKIKYMKRKNAFQKKPGYVVSSPAPVILTQEQLMTIRERKQKKYKNGSTKIKVHSISSNDRTKNEETHARTCIITVDQYKDKKKEYKLTASESPNINASPPDEVPSPIPLSSAVSTQSSLNEISLTVNDDDDDEDDYQSKWSYDDLYNNHVQTIDNNKKCLCHDFCNILCVTDFRKNWPKDAWILRSVYGSVIVYISDYITDLNILILWSIDGYNQYQYGLQPVNGLNMILMATCCLCVLLFYKIISGIAVWKATGSFVYGCLQFMDVYVFIEVYRSHVIGQKTDRLRWLSNLESIFEASPQVLLQLVYLMQSTETDKNSFIVILGLFFSVVKLGNTAINNDAVHVVKDARKVSHYKFWLRALFRITELTAIEFMYVLMWLVIGERFLIMVILINMLHNTFLYYGGCLSRQIFNIFGHTLSLAQLSYTIVEGLPMKFFLRGRLHENNPDYPHDTRSKLQFPYSIFIRRFNMAKKANHARIQTQRRLREQQSTKNKRKNRKDLDVMLSPATPLTPPMRNNMHGRKPSDLKLSNDRYSSIMEEDERSYSNINLTVDLSVDEEAKGELVLNPVHGFGLNEADDDDVHGLNEVVKLKEIEKYKTSIADMNGIYSYFTWIHASMIWYLNIYLSSQRPQQIMMIQRSIAAICWLAIIGIHGFIFRDNNRYWSTKYHRYVSFFDARILVMYCISLLFTILCMFFFWLMMEHEVINEVKKKEEIQFKTIFDAIYYGRLDAIINQFDATQHLTSLSPDAKTPLYYASELAQIDIAEWFISQRTVIDINLGATQNRTPLYIASRVGCFEIVTMLLDEVGCDYNLCNDHGRSPLYAACREGHYQIVCQLLRQPLIDINLLTLNDSCALAAACQHGWTDIVIELLRKPEIEINVLNASNYSPIFIAALGSYTEIVKLLLERDEIEIDCGTKNDESLFYVSCERGMHEIVQILIDRDDYSVDINRANSKNYTPLYIAACFGHAAIIAILMNIDESTLNVCDNNGRTPFFVACRKGHSQAVFQLLQYSDIDIHHKDHDELSPFSAACQGGSVAVVEKLMHLVDRDEIIGVDRLSRTPFFMACREGQTAVVMRLMCRDIDSVIDINQSDKLGRTPLMVAVKRAHDECVETLCRNNKIDINETDLQNRSPLYIAAKCGPSHAQPVKSLMSRHDLKINAKATNGKTALHIACELGHSSIVMLLLDHADIDVNEPDDSGTSPLAIADKKLDNNVYMRMVMISMR